MKIKLDSTRSSKSIHSLGLGGLLASVLLITLTVFCFILLLSGAGNLFKEGSKATVNTEEKERVATNDVRPGIWDRFWLGVEEGSNNISQGFYVIFGYFKERLNIDYKKVFKPNDVLNSKEVAISTLAIRNKSKERKVIGEEKIYPVLVDENEDGVDDENGADGKGVVILTDAVTDSCKIFLSFEGNPGSTSWVEKTKDPDSGRFNGFIIRLGAPVADFTKVSWWIVEEEKDGKDVAGTP